MSEYPMPASGGDATLPAASPGGDAISPAAAPDSDATSLAAAPDSDTMLPAERKIMEELGGMALDFRAMWAVSNLFRSSTAIRRHMEAHVLAADKLSWTAFTGLWVLWIWGEVETREFAAAVGISRPTATGVVTTLEARGFVRRRKDDRDGRMVLVSLTAAGRRRIERLFPLFNAEEVAVTKHLSPEQQASLAATLRTLLRTVDGDVDDTGPST